HEERPLRTTHVSPCRGKEAEAVPMESEVFCRRVRLTTHQYQNRRSKPSYYALYIYCLTKQLFFFDCAKEKSVLFSIQKYKGYDGKYLKSNLGYWWRKLSSSSSKAVKLVGYNGEISAERRSPMIYFDQAASSFPKPPEVTNAMVKVMNEAAANPGRGSHQLARKANDIISDAREVISNWIGCSDPKHVLLYSNATVAL